MTYIVKPTNTGNRFQVIARAFDGRETYIETLRTREDAEDMADALQDNYDHGTNYFINGDA